ncbi:protein kinase-like protein [Prosthecobacter fusiformis]|uniref:Protein kinase-like protein n=1 Tax=Prosthecobacter fusiformis TaxID=48464 RepID=A0A4V3FFJ7_9BACT|nr:protein kinase [Prosthecobacter fusiformis]TDU71073.1 protein kinase-like protein [Prosthecobacter fusiformis]
MSDLSAHDFPSVTELGRWLPQYEVQEQLQVYQDGALYLGRQSALGRQVVIEVIPPPEEHLANALLDRLRRRARLVHPSITAVYDFGRTPQGQFYLVGEHVDGDLLDTLISERLLKPKVAFPLALQVCEALQIVHDLPMPHGTLSTQTILVSPEGQAKLTGIGMVQKSTGELSWLAPFRGSLTGDIRALGYTLHWMFAKCAPDADGRLSRDLPPAFATVIRRCLEPGSGRQFTRAEDVAEALKDALRGEQEKGEPTTRTKMVVAPGSRQPAGPAPSSMPQAAPPPKLAPGQLKPVVRHYQPTFFQRVDAFVWKAFSTGLHMLVSLVSIGALILLFLFKDKIVFEEDTSLPMASVEEIEMEDKPIPAAVLGALPPVEALPTAPATVKPITLPVSPPAPPMDPMEDLRSQYVTAVQTAANQALEKVRLDDLPHLQRELQLLQNGGDVPSVDEPNLPASLKVLRQRYREVQADRKSK